ncbi:MAG: hypothetical protein B7Y25_04185 [Alphaproteobacteria bacterium 16-39-46]|nr:MAG: hypothetical protein B7Y25_04185 [Alphaproteobacteria bacterium 16-39-46]HQS85048.1 hypothetical protein [Alphaproteobacteria bacterium]HQS94780.1 hypothetical protein [Alphaproteobacteria bacterium]
MARFKDARTLKDEIKYKERLQTAERMGVSVAQWMSQGELEEKIRSKKRENERETKEKKLQERRNFAERMGISDARWMSQKELEETIKRKKKEKEERNKESLGMRRETREFSGAFNTPDDFMLRHITRKPGERLSYKECLEERRAFVSRGGFDAGLCRTSDDIAYDYMKSTARSYHVDEIS